MRSGKILVSISNQLCIVSKVQINVPSGIFFIYKTSFWNSKLKGNKIEHFFFQNICLLFNLLSLKLSEGLNSKEVTSNKLHASPENFYLKQQARCPPRPSALFVTSIFNLIGDAFLLPKHLFVIQNRKGTRQRAPH